MTRICFLIRQMNQGGAQRQLLEIVKVLDKKEFQVSVVTFYGGGFFRKELESIEGVTAISMEKRGRWDILPFLFRLMVSLRRIDPDILHSYLGVSNIFSVLMKPLLGGKIRVAWGVRNSDLHFHGLDWLNRFEFWLECFLARFANVIIANSQAGRAFYAQSGYPKERIKVVPNGIDVAKFQPDPEARARVRKEWGLSEGTKLVGTVGRVDPVKDYWTFLSAASILHSAGADASFVVVGGGPEAYKRKLREHARSAGISDRVIWAGDRQDMPAVYNAMDVFVSSSISEGFSNAIGEAMACGHCCVVTDVGDSAWIVGETGHVVRPGDPHAMAEVLGKCLTRASGTSAEARRRVQDEFGMEKLVERTMQAICIAA